MTLNKGVDLGEENTDLSLLQICANENYVNILCSNIQGKSLLELALILIAKYHDDTWEKILLTKLLLRSLITTISIMHMISKSHRNTSHSDHNCDQY